MPELLWNILAIIGLLCVVCTLLLGVWVAVAGTRESPPLPDEEPTLQVQNRHGDSRPLRYAVDGGVRALDDGDAADALLILRMAQRDADATAAGETRR